MTEEERKPLASILGAGGDGTGADKFRDNLDKVVTIVNYEVVQTKNGESVQLICDDDQRIWAPSVVAKQVRELADEEYLPATLRLAAVTSANGREYFTLQDPN